MSVPATASDIFLRAIWVGSLVLVVLSLAIILILVIRRLASERYEARRSHRKRELGQYFYATLCSPVALTAKNMPPINVSDYPMVMRIAVDTARSLRGDDAARIAEILRLWGLQPYLQKMMHDKKHGKRIQAITLFGVFSDQESLQLLISQAASPDIYVQIAALRSLAMRGATSSIAAIMEQLISAPNTNALMLSDVLQRFGQPAIPSLIELTKSHPNNQVCLAAVTALGAMHALNAVGPLVALLDSSDLQIRAASLAALGKIKDPKATEAILLQLEHDEAAVRMQAAQALGGLQVVQAIPALAARLEDTSWWVRFRAAEALYKSGERGIAALKAFTGQQTASGMIARQVLAELGGA